MAIMGQGKTDTLTKREVEVMQMFASGDGQKQIAYAMGISRKTVSAHITNIHSKLRVSNTLSMVLMGVKEGLIPLNMLLAHA